MCLLLKGKDPAALGALVLDREKAGPWLRAVGLMGSPSGEAHCGSGCCWPFKLSALLAPNLKLAGLCGSPRGALEWEANLLWAASP